MQQLGGASASWWLYVMTGLGLGLVPSLQSGRFNLPRLVNDSQGRGISWGSLGPILLCLIGASLGLAAPQLVPASHPYLDSTSPAAGLAGGYLLTCRGSSLAKQKVMHLTKAIQTLLDQSGAAETDGKGIKTGE